MNASPEPVCLSKIDIGKSWALDAVCALDQYAPGFAGHYLRSSRRRRQIVHAALSQIPSIRSAVDDSPFPASIESLAPDQIRALLHGRERDVIARYFGHCPVGFVSALGKMQARPEAPSFYSELFHIIDDHSNVSIANVLSHIPKIDQERVEIARTLPAPWRLPSLIEKLGTLHEARKFVRMVEIIRQWCPTATEEAIDAAVHRLSRTGTVAVFVAGWLKRAQFPSGPIADSAEIQQIRDGAKLERVARCMRNCLRDQLENILDGTSAYYTAQGLSEPVVIHLHRQSAKEEWGLEGVYIANNLPVEIGLRMAVEKMLIAHGFDPHHRPGVTRTDFQIIQNYLWSANFDRRVA